MSFGHAEGSGPNGLVVRPGRVSSGNVARRASSPAEIRAGVGAFSAANWQVNFGSTSDSGRHRHLSPLIAVPWLQ